eukprot:NODE_269_length_12236_cov_0.516932.p10 type:complete len:104 gc:universal NODE_269_length_12236_cov_0.516932:4835-5146(+)
MLMDILQGPPPIRRNNKPHSSPKQHNIPTSYTIPTSKVGHVIGKKGATIKEIKSLSNCQISLTQQVEDASLFTCELKGTSQQIKYANDLIQQALTKATEFENE